MKNQPLKGRTILITRAKVQASPFAKRLRTLGAKVLSCPTIKIIPPTSTKPLDSALRKIESYDWIIFSSANAVERFSERMKKVRKNRKLPVSLKTCAIGPATARAMRIARIPVTKISKDFVDESILDILKAVRGKKILIPRAQQAREVLPSVLKKRGARVHVVPAYRTMPDKSGIKRLKSHLTRTKIDSVAFTSSSTVTNFFKAVGSPSTLPIAASIGPVTSGTLAEYGIRPLIVARKPSTRFLAEAIADYFGKLTA